MQSGISKENLADLAQHAVSSLRRLVSSSYDSLTLSQQDLLSSSRRIDESWQRRREQVDAGSLELWGAGFADELRLQLHPEEMQRQLPEASMLMNLEAARTVLCYAGGAAVEVFMSSELVSLLVQYFTTTPLSKKARDACAATLITLAGHDPRLTRELVEVALPLLVAQPPSTHHTPDAENPTEALTTVNPIFLYLATLLVAALHREDSAAATGVIRGRSDAYQPHLLSTLRSAYALLLSPGILGNNVPTSSVEGTASYQVTVCAVYLALVGGLLRGNPGSKVALIEAYAFEFSHVWTFVVTNLTHMDTFLFVPTNISGKGALVALDGVSVWQSELHELLVELCTDSSFCLQRLRIAGQIPDGGDAASSSPLPSSDYVPLPIHWDTVVTGGSQLVWRLASLVFSCTLTPVGSLVLQVCLMRIDCSIMQAESLYRAIMATLMLLCIANPYNATVLADASMLQCLIALVTYRQPSVFPSSVMVRLPGGEPVEIAPVSHLSTSTTQLTESLMSTIASICFPRDMLQLAMSAVTTMCHQSACQTDADVVELLLHALASSAYPPRTLFFQGNSSIVCKADRFAGRWYGYSLSAWVSPMCVWSEGSHLFSFTEQSGTSMTICVVANGRTCSLAILVATQKDLTVTHIPDSPFPADSWTHIVFTHSITGTALYVNGKKLEVSASIPFPKEPSKRHRLDLAFGGLIAEPSFFGHMSSIELFETSLSEKDVGRLYAGGTGTAEVLEVKPLLTVCPYNPETTSACMSSVQVTGSVFDKNEGGVSVHGVVSCQSTQMLTAFQDCGVMGWALKTLEDSHTALNNAAVARLCLTFVATAMRMTKNDEELNRILAGGYMDRLQAEILSWEDTFLEFPAILLSAATSFDEGKSFRTHPSTQTILTTLLGRLEGVGGATLGGKVVRHSNSCCILRELSDWLLPAENLAAFLSVPDRFERVLSLCVQLPLECIESVVVLIEKLCKGQLEVEKTLRFLVLRHECNSGDADIAKTEILRMLFDVSRANVEMCELIGGAFKGCGASFLMMLISGMNHTSEATRVFALRLFSLLMHVNRKFRESFVKAHGFRVFARALTNPACPISIRLPTLDCLFQMAFDAYRPTEKSDDAISSRLSLAKGKTKRGLGRPHDLRSSQLTRHNAGFPGHLPGLVSRRLKLSRREYSFEVSHDFARVDDRLHLNEPYRNMATLGLQIPPAFETALWALKHMVAGMSGGHSLSGSSSLRSRSANLAVVTDHDYDSLTEGTPEAVDSPSVTTPIEETDEHPDRIVIHVLTYVEKVIDVTANGEALLHDPWLDWLWDAVSPLIQVTHRTASGESVSSVSRYPKNFLADVLTRFRRIVRRLMVLDMNKNGKAASVRHIRGFVQPPMLIRIVLEETMRHFARGVQAELTEQTNASNVIKNLDYLLSNIEYVLHPFPTTLGIEIISGISAIAIRNNSWVRMRMKNTTHLFSTRDRLAFFLLSYSRSFVRIQRELLFQLLDANATEVNTVAVLLQHLSGAMRSRHVEEVEVTVELIRLLAASYEEQRQEIYRIVSPTAAALADILCLGCGKWLLSDVLGHSDDARTCNESNGAEPAAASDTYIDDSPSVRTTSQVVEWVQAHPNEWAALTLTLDKIGKGDDSSKVRERVEKERSYILKATKAQKEVRDQLEARVQQQCKRMAEEVEAEISAATAH